MVFILAGESERSAGEIYFISSDEIYTWRDVEVAILRALDKKVLRVKIPAPILYSVSFVSETICKVFGKASPLNFEKIKDVRQKNWACSVEKAKKELGFRHKVSLEEGNGKDNQMVYSKRMALKDFSGKIFAFGYDVFMFPIEKFGLEKLRAKTLSFVEGKRILEVGVGDGVEFSILSSWG
jgi:hypothetical protein